MWPRLSKKCSYPGKLRINLSEERKNFPDTFFPLSPSRGKPKRLFSKVRQEYDPECEASSLQHFQTHNWGSHLTQHCTASYCWARVPVGLSPSNEQSLGNWTPYEDDSPQETLLTFQALVSFFPTSCMSLKFFASFNHGSHSSEF